MAVEETLAQSADDTTVVLLPTMVTLPDFDGTVSNILTVPLDGNIGELALCNAAGASIPFALFVVSAPGEERAKPDPGGNTLLAFPDISSAWQPSLELDVSVEDLMTAQAGGHHATVILLVGPEL